MGAISRNVILSEEQVKELIDNDIARIKSWKFYNRFADFEDEYPDYSFEFCLFTPEQTGLSVDIMLDETANHIYDEHPLFLCFRNGGDDCVEYVPVAVHRFRPFILDETIRINIPREDVRKILKFVRRHYYTISDYGYGHITRKHVAEVFRRNPLNESRLDEMPVINGSDVGLPFDIWVDMTKRNMKHGKRIKFRSNDTDVTRGWSSMSIDKVEPTLFNFDDKQGIKTKDLEKLKEFIRLNYEPLSLAADGKVKNVDVLVDMMMSPRDVTTLVQKDNNVYIDIIYTDERLYFIGDGKEKTIELISKMCGVEPFHEYGRNGLYVVINDANGNSVDFAEKLKNMLYKAAKELGLRLVITNDARLAENIERYRTT